MRPVVSRDDGAGALQARRHPRWLVPVLLAVVTAPLVVAAVALRRPPWYPVLDHAMAELRLHDVFTRHTPLIGLPGRIGRFPDQGSHPGPLSFYALWPTWKLLGSSPWAMQAGALVLNAVAASAAVLVALRRGGARLAITVTALLALLMGGYGIETLAEPWNPYLPLLWWVLALLCVWSVLDGDLPLLPVGVFAASIAAQTHVPYLGLCLGMSAVVAAGLVQRWRRDDDRRALARWSLVAVALGALLWSPLVVEQATDERGNLTMLWRHFTSPPDEEGEPIGLGEGIELQLRHLDVTAFVRDQGDSLGSLARSSGDAGGSARAGTVVLVVWLAAAAVAWRRRVATLNRLNAIIAAALLLGAFSMSRIFGKVWYYLMLWSWGTVTMLVLSVLATVALVHGRPERTRVGVGVLAAAGLLSAGLLTVQAASADPPAPQLSAALADVVPRTAARLDRDDTYLVTWDDSFYIGSQGMGLVSALDRLGFDVGASDTWRVPLTEHRVVDAADADLQIELAVGTDFVARWRALAPDAEVAAADPRSAREVAEYDELRASVIDELTAAGLVDDVALVDGNLFGLSLHPRLDDGTRDDVERMLELGAPLAVFLVPVGTLLPTT